MKFVMGGESEKVYVAPTSGNAPPTPSVKQPSEMPVTTKTPETPVKQATPAVKPTIATPAMEKQTTIPSPVKQRSSQPAPAKQGAIAAKPSVSTPTVTIKTKTEPLDEAVKIVETEPVVTEKKPVVAAKSATPTVSQTVQTHTEPLDEAVKNVEKPASNTETAKENVKVVVSTVEKTFTGYKVEVFASKDELPETNPDLKMIALDLSSNIQTDKLETGQTSYMIGSFLNWGETERFLEKVQKKYPKAQIVDYFNGKRIGN